MPKRLFSSVFAFCLFTVAFAAVGKAEILMIGNDTSAAAAQYDLNGNFLGFFGPSGATGTAFDGAGHVFIDYPVSNTIQEFDSSATLLNTIPNTGGFGEDLSRGPGNTLYVSEASGEIVHIDLSGTILDSFDSGAFGSGIAFDGTFLYTSDGFGGTGVITQRLLDGTPTGTTINASFSSNLSLGYDAEHDTFWEGRQSEVAEFDRSGNLLFSFSTPDSAYYHDGIDVGSFDVTTNPVPEPASFVLIASALVGLGLVRRRRLS